MSWPLLVERPLEDESDEALLAAQLLGAEGAGGVESVRAVRERDLAPEGRRLVRADVSAGVEGVSGRGCVYVEACLAAQPQGHVRPLGPAHGALPEAALAALPLLAVVAPVVVAVHVAALQVHPRLLLVRRVLAAHGGEGQRVEAHRALRPCRVDLLPQRLQVFEGGGARQALGGAPQQSGAAEVDEGAVHQLLSLSLHLKHNTPTSVSQGIHNILRKILQSSNYTSALFSQTPCFGLFSVFCLILCLQLLPNIKIMNNPEQKP